MENAYIKELIMTLEHTEICQGNNEEVKSGSEDWQFWPILLRY